MLIHELRQSHCGAAADVVGHDVSLNGATFTVIGEFRDGIAQSKRRSSYEAWLESSLIHFDIVSMTDETAVAYAALPVTLKQSGRQIPASDAWIAALALQHRLPVLSHDEHFDVVPGFNRRSWSPEPRRFPASGRRAVALDMA